MSKVGTFTRRSFALRLGKTAALAGAVISTAGPSEAQVVWSEKEWALADFNELLTAQGELKQVFDVTSPVGSLDKVKNSLNGLQVGFGLQPSAIRTVVGLHGPANFLNFGDPVWEKYPIGKVFGIKSSQGDQPATRNEFYLSPFPPGSLNGDPSALHSAWHDASMQGLRRRGVKFLGCHTALEFQVRQLIAKAALPGDPETIVRDMLQHLLPGSLMVVSMVSALAMLQAKGAYAYLKL